VRISPKSAKESWYKTASKEGVIKIGDDGDIYRVEVRSGGKYYQTLWGWLKRVTHYYLFMKESIWDTVFCFQDVPGNILMSLSTVDG
jgi:hypothetical protein